MVQLLVTPKAVQRVKGMIQQQSNEKLSLRIFVQAGGCAGFKYGLAFDDNPASDDEVVQVDGIRVLVDPASAPFVNGAEVDYVESLQGAGFKIQNPNAEASCGCGTSFRMKGM